MAEQLSFDLPRRTARAREDFFISPANALAVALIDDWRNWPGGKLTLSGPAGSGKTHLTHVWTAQTGARIVAARKLTEEAVPALAQGPVAVEDVPGIAADPRAQAALFHLHNLVLAQGHRLLMTGREAPRRWGLTLPDLQSRVEGAQNAPLDEPDDALLGAVLAKLFADRQITPRPGVIPFLLPRIERSFEAAAEVVEHLDRGALNEGKPLTRQLAVRLMADFRSHRDGAGN